MSWSSGLIDGLLALWGEVESPCVGALSEEGVLMGRRGGGTRAPGEQGEVLRLMELKHRDGDLMLRTQSTGVKKRLFVSTSWLEKGFYDSAKGGGWLKKQFKGKNLAK